MNLDEMLSLDEAAEWLGLTRRVILTKTKGRSPIIPAFRLSSREYRFHPRTIIAKMAADAGLSKDLIAASFGIAQKENPTLNPKEHFSASLIFSVCPSCGQKACEARR